MEFRPAAFACSQFLWIFYVVGPILAVAFGFEHYNGGQLIKSLRTPYWDADKDPLVFAHFTDIHVSEKDDSIPVLRELFAEVNRYYPEFVLMTGDLSDNYDHHNAPRYGYQVESFWKRYAELKTNLSSPVVDVAGNHDMWGVGSFTSAENFFLDYSTSFKRNETTEQDFLVKTVKYHEYSLVLVNPYAFPAARPPMLFWVCPDTEILDAIETAVTENQNVILCSHYPTDMWCKKKSSKGRTFADLVESANVIVHLTGHSHPTNPEFKHIGTTGALEIIGPAAYAKRKFGIVSIDNGKPLWTTIDMTSTTPQNKVIVTHPIPKQQLTPHENFADLSTDVRVVAFTDALLTIKVSGAVTGTLVRRRKLSSGGWLYSLPLILDRTRREYEIKFSGDYTGSVQFTLSETYKQPQESAVMMPNTLTTLFYVLPVCWILLVIIALPVDILLFDEAEAWIEGVTDNSYLLFAILGGFLIMRVRLARLPKWIRWVLFGAAMWPLCLPTIFIKIEEFFGMIWSYGYVANNNTIFSYYGPFFSFFYLAGTVMLALMFASGIEVGRTVKGVMISNWVIFAISVIVDIVVVLRFVCQTAGYALVCASPGFVIIPIILWAILIRHALSFKYEVNSNLGHPLIELN